MFPWQTYRKMVNQNSMHILSRVTDIAIMGEIFKKLFHDQSLRKYWTGPGSNSRSLDLQSDWLQTARGARCSILCISMKLHYL